MPKTPDEKCKAGHLNWHWSDHCGAWVCDTCDDHKGLARCYCGWAADGGDGRRELIECGENLDSGEDY